MKMIRTSYNLISLFIIFVLISHNLVSQTKGNSLKEISGKVTNLKAPLANVNIRIIGTTKGAKTDAKGHYSIKAKAGDQIQYSYIGFKTVTIIVEDITEVLNINMVQKSNELAEIEITADKKWRQEMQRFTKTREKFQTSRGTFNPEAGNTKTIDGNDIHSWYMSVGQAIMGKFAGVKVGPPPFYKILSVRGQGPVLWEIDGSIYLDEPRFLISLPIESVHIPMSLSARVRWGGRPVIIVHTKNGSFKDREAREKEIASQYTNKNYYKDDAVSYSSLNQQDQDLLKEISGKVTYQNTPLFDTNIIVKDQANKGTKTNAQGNYMIMAREGEFIEFRYMGFKTITIMVEDVTSTVNIEMIEDVQKLEETVLEDGSKKSRILKHEKKKRKKFLTSRGEIDPEKAGYAVGYFDGTNISNIYNNLTDALVGRTSGYYIKGGKPYLRGSDTPSQSYPAIWDIDGVIFIVEPVIDLTQIKDIRFLKSLAATNRYGSAGVGGVIVVTTKYASFADTEANNKETNTKYTNKDLYNNDAVTTNTEELITSPYYDTITNIKIKVKAFTYYQENLKPEVNNFSDYIDIAKIFKVYYKDMRMVSQILNDLALANDRNPEILKAVAYQMQAYDLKEDAIGVYKRIFKLRPKYAQSYRDLANAFKDNRQYNKAWKLYMAYIFQRNDVSGQGIGKIMYNELEWLYYNKNNRSIIKVQFEPQSKNINDFRNDVRLVFEWNTSEAEFDLEFVNPKRQVYVFEHSLEKNQGLITDEKQKGYSSKEFIISDVKEFSKEAEDDQWLVNLTYKGNKKAAPTYFKATRYYNWGKPNEQKNITLYKLEKEHTKILLYRLNKESLLVKK